MASPATHLQVLSPYPSGTSCVKNAEGHVGFLHILSLYAPFFQIR